jgi:carboxylate-amine ligase
MDVCTNVDDSIALASLNVCLLRMLYRLRRNNQIWRVYAHMLVNENRWRAMRYSFDEGLLDLAKGELVPFSDLLEEMLELVKEDAEAIGCAADIEHARTILKRGTSAHRQVKVFEDARNRGASEREGLNAVVDWLIRETASGLG